MKRTFEVFIATALLLLVWADAASAAEEWKGYGLLKPVGLYKFATENYVAGKILATLGVPKGPPVGVVRIFKKEDVTRVINPGTYEDIWIGENEVVYSDGGGDLNPIWITKNMHIGRNSVMILVNYAAIAIDVGASLEIPSNEGLVQILGTGYRNLFTTTSGTVGLYLGYESKAVIHNTIIAGHSRGIFISNGRDREEEGSDEKFNGANVHADGLFLTDNVRALSNFVNFDRPPITGQGAVVQLTNGGIWDNGTSGEIPIWITLPVKFETTNTYLDDRIWLKSHMTKEELLAMSYKSKVVFLDCYRSDQLFMYNLKKSIENPENKNEDFLGEFTFVQESRPGGPFGKQNIVQIYPRETDLPKFDFTGNGEIEIEDVLYLADDFGSQVGITEFAWLYDKAGNSNGTVDLPDLIGTAYAYVGLPRTATLAEFAANSKTEPLIRALMDYPAVIDAAKADPEFGPLVESVINSTAVLDETAAKPNRFVLHQNYPNPFNAQTTIRFELAEDSHVELAVYNMAGQIVRLLTSARLSTGVYTEPWDGKDNFGVSTSTGIYLCELRAGSERMVRKIMLLR